MRAFVIIASLSFAVISCERVPEQQKPTDGSVPAAPSSQAMPPALEGQIAAASVVLTTSSGTHRVQVEIARSDEERARGLMRRESLPENQGMWFIFPEEVQDPFWMKDTLISLDIIFVGSDNKVVDIIANTTPQSTDLLTPKARYRSVLEVNAGFSAKRGIRVGDSAELKIP